MAGAVVCLAWAASALRSAPWRPPAGRFAAQARGAGRGAVSATREFVAAGPGAVVHVPSLAELPDGRLAVAWYAGSRELARDVAVFVATREPGGAWSAPRPVVDRRAANRELRRPVGKVGNAVLFTDLSSRLWLVYATMPEGGWALASLAAKSSDDGGATWSDGRPIALSPFFDLGTLAKNKPLLLEDGALLLPVEHGLFGRFPEVVRLQGTPDGRLEWSKSRVCGGRAFHQPALVADGPRSALCVLRSGSAPGRVGIAVSLDGGASWSAPRATALPNPDAGLDAIALPGGRVLLAFDDDPAGRSSLALALSRDRGATWTRVATVEREAGAEFSYPSLLRTRDGSIHLVYTWKRRAIRHLEFGEAFLEAAGAGARP